MSQAQTLDIERPAEDWLEARPTGAAADASIAVTARRVLADHRAFIGLILSYIVLRFGIQWWFDIDEMRNLRFWSETLIIVGLGYVVLFACGHATWMMLKHRGNETLFAATWADLRRRYLQPDRLIAFLIVFLIIPPFMSAFGAFKQAIPLFNGFSWDPAFMQWDRALHGGHHPWELMQPVLGHPLVTSIVNFFYNAWFFLMFGIVFWQAWSGRRQLRMQFFCSFVLIWGVIGTLMAITLSSAGPCYYGRVTDQQDPFAPLMEYLYTARESYPVWALYIQEVLWEGYQTGAANLIKGITAMPSMHVSAAVLFALLGWRTNRWAGIALTLFAIMIQIGSVHLGWHYAIDGYIAAVVTIVIWAVVGWMIRRQSRPDARGKLSGHPEGGASP